MTTNLEKNKPMKHYPIIGTGDYNDDYEIASGGG
jgi:hypothetical protein